MKTTIYLVRHGEYANPKYLFPGRLPEFPLTERGREQVEKLAIFFQKRPIVAIYSSPLLRTRQTAEIIASHLDLSIKFDDRLLEVRTNLEGISMQKFDETNGELSYLPQYYAKGAESMDELASRMVGFIEEKRKEHQGKNALVITHGDPMRFVVMKYMGLPIMFPASHTLATPLAGGYRIEFDWHVEPQVYPIVTT